MVYPVFLQYLSTLSLINLQGIKSSAVTTSSSHTGHLLPLFTIPFLAHKSQADPAQHGIITASSSKSLQMGHCNSLGILTIMYHIFEIGTPIFTSPLLSHQSNQL